MEIRSLNTRIHYIYSHIHTTKPYMYKRNKNSNNNNSNKSHRLLVRCVSIRIKANKWIVVKSRNSTLFYFLNHDNQLIS